MNKIEALNEKALEAAAKALIDRDQTISGYHPSHIEAKKADAGAAIRAYLTASDAEREPVIHAEFETVGGGLIGTASAPIKRIERQDDGSLTVVIDHWPPHTVRELEAENARLREERDERDSVATFNFYVSNMVVDFLLEQEVFEVENEGEAPEDAASNIIAAIKRFAERRPVQSIDHAIRKIRELEKADETRAQDISRLTIERDAAEARLAEALKALEEAKRTNFNIGYTLAVANLINLHDKPSVAADVMAQTDITLKEITAMGLSDYDLKPLRKMFREEPVLLGNGRAARRVREGEKVDG